METAVLGLLGYVAITAPLYVAITAPLAGRRPQAHLRLSRSSVPQAAWEPDARRSMFEEASHACQHGECEMDRVPELLNKLADADRERVAGMHYGAPTERMVVNLTCAMPADGVDAMHEVFNSELLAMPIQTGRLCTAGTCSPSCSRVILRHFALPDECALLARVAEELMPATTPTALRHDVYLADAARAAAVGAAPSAARGHLQFLLVVERMRRAIALEYGLPLRTLRPRLAFISRIAAPDDIADFDVGELHADECSDATYHYSGILYINSCTARDPAGDFDGGELCFVERDGERRLLAPQAGMAAMFSSGWENMHIVAPVRAGARLALPMFFTTQAAEEDSILSGADDGSASAERARVDALRRIWTPHVSEEDQDEFLRLWPRFFGHGGA